MLLPESHIRHEPVPGSVLANHVLVLQLLYRKKLSGVFARQVKCRNRVHGFSRLCVSSYLTLFMYGLVKGSTLE